MVPFALTQDVKRCAVQWTSLMLVLFFFLVPSPALAYIGPGAGFAFIGSTLVFFLTALMAVATFFFWPVQALARKVMRRGIPRSARTRRLVILGLDGLEPTLVEEYMAQGHLPNLCALRESGSYSRLRTTLPALSPVAWSTFQTGVNPGAHNIFDFLTRDKRTCLPLLSSSRVNDSRGWWKRRRQSVELLRRSRTFWSILGSYGIFSNIIRVPISYPPEKFGGNILAAMCTPDLRGTQGSFTLFTTRSQRDPSEGEGTVVHVERKGEEIHMCLEGPSAPGGGEALKVSLSIQCSGGSGVLTAGGERVVLNLNEFSPWVRLGFGSGRRTVHGICRFCLREVEPEFSLYVSPINIDPELPALPLSYPRVFSAWLAKKQGLYGTLGLAEDTWGRNEAALDDQRFLDQAYLTHEERERMFFEALRKTTAGACIGVFDASDRIQHMFWRYIDEGHPSPQEDSRFASVIPDMYRRMDDLVGRVRGELRRDDVFVVLSDHGFASFRRCVNLNTWLLGEGYLALKEGAPTTGCDYLQNVDWPRTRAYAIGLSGIFLNRQGRERCGIVSADEAPGLKAELIGKLEALRDGTVSPIRRVYDSGAEYRGLYAEEAPDLIIGYNPGYRVSWESVTGAFEREIFSDNTKAWSGDHHVDPELIPGILFANRPLRAENPHIADIAPTALDLFSVKIPPYMEGQVIL